MNEEAPTLRDGAPPYLARWRLATSLLAVAGVLCIAVAVLQGEGILPHAMWTAVLLHGLEGALVGGLCDWFAVVKTYRAVETYRDEVADGIGDWVRDELLSEHVIRKQVDAVLDSPGTRDALYARLDKELGSRDDLTKKVDGVVASIETRIVPAVVEFELGDLGTTKLDDFTDDARMEPVLRTCLAEAVLTVVEQPETAEVIDAALKQYVGIFRSLGLAKKERVIDELRQSMIQFRDDAMPAGDNALIRALEARTDRLLSIGVASYLHAWNALSELERRNAVTALLERARPVVVTGVTAWIESQRDELRQMPTLKDYEIAVSIRDLLVDRIDQTVSDGVGNAVRESLKEQPAAEFREMLEWQTRRQLESIRLSGTMMGVVVGAFLGGVLYSIGA